MKKLKLIRNVLAVLAVLATVVFISCGALLGDGQIGNITINLPPISSQARAISSDKISDLKNVTTSYRVTASGMTREGTGGTYTFTLPVGMVAEITVECLNSSGNVIVRAKKTHTVTAGANNVDIILSRDGDVVGMSNADLKSTPVVGSIIMKDGTLCDTASVVGREADAIAVVYKVANGKAWAIGKTHEKNGLAWCLQNANGYNNIDTLVTEMDNDAAGQLTFTSGTYTDGSAGLNLLQAAVNDYSEAKYPAWYWSNNYGSTNCSDTNFTTGWYFPSLAELFDIWKANNTSNDDVETALEKCDGSKFETSFYWSSSEETSGSPYYLNFGSGAWTFGNKLDDFGSVCAVRAFTY